MIEKHLLLLLATFVMSQYVYCDTEDHNDKCTVTAQPNSTATITCTLASESVTWQKFNKDGNESVDIAVEDAKYEISTVNKTLSIKKVGEDFSGLYACTVGSEVEKFTVCVLPYVKEYDKDKNVIEGDPFQSECVAWGYPAVTVTWTRITKNSDSASEEVIVASDGIILKDGSCKNSTIRIKHVQDTDAGIYTCRVTSPIGSANATITVHVKDKLAALWPFLGICAEVAILCIIIFFYERRRAKRLENEAASEEADRMNVNNETKISDDVRHRK